MNEKQQQLTFDKGITNVPSDAICSDNSLEECVGMVYDNGEYRPLQDPVRICDDNGASIILCIHKIGTTENFIAYYETRGFVGYFRRGWTESETREIVSVGSSVPAEGIQAFVIGKTLVIKTSETSYFLWNGNRYKPLGNSVPSPTIRFSTYSQPVEWYDAYGKAILGALFSLPVPSIYLERSPDDPEASQLYIANENKGYDPLKQAQYWVNGAVGSENYNKFQIWIKGKYLMLRNNMRRRGMFTDPFAVRYAVELFDGTFINRSVPILMFPTVNRNEFMIVRGNSVDGDVETHDSWMYVRGGDLRYMASYDFEEWSDIVKSVKIFMSDFADLARTDLDSLMWTYYLKDADGNRHAQNHKMNWVSEGEYSELDIPFNLYEDIYRAPYCTLMMRDNKDIIDELMSKENFYEIAELTDLKRSDTDWHTLREEGLIKENTLTDITTLPTLGEGYFEKAVFTSASIFAYNNRLIHANLVRQFYKGDSHFIGYSRDERYYDVYVFIDGLSDGTSRIVHHNYATSDRVEYYFYYPDPRARRVMIFSGGKKIVDEKLKEHEHLNGAYFLKELPGTEVEWLSSTENPPVANEEPEVLTNQLYVSSVNNPWVYEASGNLTAGLGSIIGVASLTTALSQGQFGQFPLIIFSSDGIWAASLDTVGQFVAVHPMSRDVCNNAKSITQTDGAIFFSSDKGLMVVAGSEVKCLSEQLQGDFPNRLKTAVLAYDYRDSLLWIVNAEKLKTPWCWVYSIKEGTFHTSTYFVALQNDETGDEPVLFAGFVSTDTVCEGEYDADALTRDLKGKIDGKDLFYVFSPGSGNILFVPGHGFYDVRQITYQITYDDAPVTIRRGYGIFNGSDRYSHGADALYRRIDNGKYYVWSDNSLVEAESKYFDGYGETASSGLVFDTMPDETALKEKLEEQTGNVVAVSSTSDGIVVFDRTEKVFMLSFTVYYYVEGSAVQKSEYVYVRSDDEVDDFMQDGSPKTGVFFRTYSMTDGLLFWDGEKLAVKEEYPFLSESEESQDTLFNDSAYDEAAVVDAIKEAEGIVAEVKGLRITGRRIVFNNGTGVIGAERFLEQVDFSYIVSGKQLSGTSYYTRFDGDGSYVGNDGKPIDGTLYFNGLNYFQWENGKFKRSSAGLASVVNSYPDTLFHLLGDGIYSLLERPQPSDDEKTDYEGCIVTRPMKLENGLALKSIMQIRHICQFSPYTVTETHEDPETHEEVETETTQRGSMTLRIFASNNLDKNPDTWVELHSLRGTPWKYYKFQYDFENLLATDRFAGTILVTQERRTNKLR